MMSVPSSETQRTIDTSCHEKDIKSLQQFQLNYDTIIRSECPLLVHRADSFERLPFSNSPTELLTNYCIMLYLVIYEGMRTSSVSLRQQLPRTRKDGFTNLRMCIENESLRIQLRVPTSPEACG